LGNKSTNEGNIKIKTDQSVAEMTLAFQKNQKEVLAYILDVVQNIVPKEHENLR
jgi:hypothetical protein